MTAPDMPRTAYSYTRLSTTEQMKGHGKQRQNDGYAALCRLHQWTSARELFADDGLSAFSGANLTHGELGRFFDLVRAGKIKKGSILVCESLDRLIRPTDMAAALRLWSAFLENGISVATVIGQRVYDAFAPDFGSTLLALAEMDRGGNESRTKSVRLKAWWEQARAKQTHTRPPAWLSPKKGDDWPERADRVQIVRDIFRLAREGVSIDRIAAHLNQTKVPPMGNRGKNNRVKAWNAGYVSRILTSKAVLGEFTPHAGSLRHGKAKERRALEPIQGYYPAIISEDEFYTVQTMLKNRRKQTGPRKSGQPTNLFTGLVKDAWDGSAMSVAQKGADHPDKMLVSYAASVGTAGSRYMGIRYSEVEAVILDSLIEIKPADLIETAEGDGLAALEGRLEEINDSLTQIKTRLKAKTTATLLDTAEQLEDEREQLRRQIDTLKAEAAGSSADHLTQTQSLLRMLKDATEQERVKLRDKLKGQIPLVVSEVWLYVFTKGKRPGVRWPQKWCLGEVYLKSGKTFGVIIKQGDWRIKNRRRDDPRIDLRTFPALIRDGEPTERENALAELEAEVMAADTLPYLSK